MNETRLTGADDEAVLAKKKIKRTVQAPARDRLDKGFTGTQLGTEASIERR